MKVEKNFPTFYLFPMAHIVIYCYKSYEANDKKLIIEFSDERLITPSGLSLGGQMLGKSNFIKKCNNMKIDGKRSHSQNGDILLSYIGLLCQRKTSYEDIRDI